MAQLCNSVASGQTISIVNPQAFLRNERSLHRNSRSLSVNRSDVEAAPPLQEDNYVQSLPPATQDAERFVRQIRIGINASWVVNIALLVVKIVAFVLSGSYAVLASAMDSLVDTLSQAVLALAEHQATRSHQRFPIGRTRISELAVLACAAIMFVSTAIVIREAIGCLYEGFHGHPSLVKAEAVLFIVLGAATACKLGLWLYCRMLMKNPIMLALAQDHLNDVMSNVAAIVGAAVSGFRPRYWYVDPLVALGMSLVIVWNWLVICWDQGQKIIGLEAPAEVVQQVKEVACSHHRDMGVDRITAYHHGSNVVVEVDVVMPSDMSVRDSHDIALALQHKIEAIETVERAFVHVDYEQRDLEEHKVERNLKQGEKDIMKPLPGYDLLPLLQHQQMRPPSPPPPPLPPPPLPPRPLPLQQQSVLAVSSASRIPPTFVVPVLAAASSGPRGSGTDSPTVFVRPSSLPGIVDGTPAS